MIITRSNKKLYTDIDGIKYAILVNGTLATSFPTGNYKVDISIEPVSFVASGRYLDYVHKPEGIKMEPTAEKSYDELKKEAVDNFGGKNGWEQLLHASEYRDIPQALLDFAAITTQRVNPIISRLKKIKEQIMEFFGIKSKDNQEKTQR